MKALVAATIAVLILAPAGDAVAKKKHHHHKKHTHHAKKHKARPKLKPAPSPPLPSQPESFDGTCEFSGAVKFTPRLTSSPQPVSQHADAPGTCSGRFVDGFGGTHELTEAATRYRAESSSDSGSCLFGLAAGTGTITFPDGEIAFTMHEYRPAATPLIRLDGHDGGGAWMPVTPSQHADPVAAVQACNADGLSEFKLDAHLRTDGAISG